MTSYDDTRLLDALERNAWKLRYVVHGRTYYAICRAAGGWDWWCQTTTVEVDGPHWAVHLDAHPYPLLGHGRTLREALSRALEVAEEAERRAR